MGGGRRVEIVLFVLIPLLSSQTKCLIGGWTSKTLSSAPGSITIALAVFSTLNVPMITYHRSS